MTSPRQIETMQAEVAMLQLRLCEAQHLVGRLYGDVERAARRQTWLADWNRLSAQQQFALGQITKGFRRGLNVRTAESLERLGLIERDEVYKWRATEAGAKLAECRENGDSRLVTARTSAQAHEEPKQALSTQGAGEGQGVRKTAHPGKEGSKMGYRKRELGSRQLDHLKWFSDGVEREIASYGGGVRDTAYSLVDRGLVADNGGKLTITDAGREYLARTTPPGAGNE